MLPSEVSENNNTLNRALLATATIDANVAQHRHEAENFINKTNKELTMKLSHAIITAVAAFSLSLLFLSGNKGSITGQAVASNPASKSGIIILMLLSLVLLGLYFVTRYNGK